MMRLVMAVSADGFVAKSETDNMLWLGPDDKTAFKLLTVAGSGVCGASSKTLNLMPCHLAGRRLVRISHSNFCLAAFAQSYPEASLIGGQTLAIAALEEGFIDVAHICRSKRLCYSGQEDKITLLLQELGFFRDAKMDIGDTTVETYRTWE